jgi:hypothetical protein
MMGKMSMIHKESWEKNKGIILKLGQLLFDELVKRISYYVRMT